GTIFELLTLSSPRKSQTKRTKCQQLKNGAVSERRSSLKPVGEVQSLECQNLEFCFLGVIKGGDFEFNVRFGKKAVTWAWHSIFCFHFGFLGDSQRLGQIWRNVNGVLRLRLWGTGQLIKIKIIAVLFGKLGGPKQ
ncbi:hypothetical protein BpHYR1_021078, partial [Brachionus plicatilis]